MSKPWWIELSSTLVGGGEYPVELAKCVQASVDTIVIKKKKQRKKKELLHLINHHLTSHRRHFVLSPLIILFRGYLASDQNITCLLVDYILLNCLFCGKKEKELVSSIILY